MDALKTAIARARHPRYYFKDGSMIIYCGGALYNIHQSVFEQRSALIADLMKLPQAEGEQPDGASDEKPIIFAGLDQTDFEFLLVYMYNHEQEAEPSIPYLVALLKMASYFLIPDARSFAIKNLGKHPALTPALQLQLAHQFEVDNWLEPAFRALVCTPLAHITVDDAAVLGGASYYVLSQTKGNIENFIRSIAFLPPPFTPGLCDRSHMCEAQWKAAWWNGFAKLLLHPDRITSSGDIFHELFDLTSIPNVCSSCLRFTLDNVYENRNPFSMINDLVEDGLENLKRLLN